MDCLVEVNHAAAAALLKGQRRANKQGVDDHKKGDKLCHTLHCDFIFLLFILADKIKKVSFFSLSLPEAINYAK